MQADTVGGITPAVLVTLKTGEKVLSAHGLMLYKEPAVKVHRRTMKSLGVGMTHLLSMKALGDNEDSFFFAEYEGPGHVSLSRDKGGEVRIVPLPPGQTLRLRNSHLIAFDESVKYYPMVLLQYQDPIPDQNGQRQVHMLFADELTGPGTIVFQSYGNILSFDLKPGESVRTSVDGLLAVANTVTLKINWLAASQMAGGAGNVVLPVVDVIGPGTAMVHSGL